MTIPNPQDPNSALYQFVDTQPADVRPCQRDSSLSHFTTRQFTPEAITAALPVVVTLTAHGFVNGQTIRATQFIRYPTTLATGMEQLNNQSFTIQHVTANTFELWNGDTNPIDGRGFTPYIQGGQFTLTGQFPSIYNVNPSFFPPLPIPDPFV